MIYHEISQIDPVKAFLNLEELVFLSTITGQRCQISNYSNFENVLDLSFFEKIEIIPDVLSCDISDYVCVFDDDSKDIECSEFLRYRNRQFGKVFRLDKFEFQDINVIMSKINYYESKYFSLNNAYSDAIKIASEYQLNEKYINKFSHLKKIIMNYPLFVFEPTMMSNLTEKYEFGFEKCYYIADCNKKLVKDFFLKHKIESVDFRDFLVEFNAMLINENEKLISMVVADSFSDIYGMPNNNLFAALSKIRYKQKGWKPKIIGKYNFAITENFDFKTVDSSFTFSFAQKNFNLSRTDILSLMRFPESVNYEV